MLVNNSEHLLNWIQWFYNDKIDMMLLPNTISDSQIDSYNSFEKLPFSAELLKIYNISNPGWELEFCYINSLYRSNKWKDININFEPQHDDNWFFSKKWLDYFNAASGPLYLSVCLEAFRCFIEQEELIIDDLTAFREKLKTNNPLLCWLEEFYFSCCDTDWEHMYGYSLISLKEGWLMTLSVEELYYEDAPFERVVMKEEDGEVECYMLKSQFIIRANHRGLITGIRIFKEWIESQPAYEEKRKYID